MTVGLASLYARALLCAMVAGSAPTVRVAFIGNSYTYVNDVPSMLVNLAASGGGTPLTQH